MKIYLFDLLAYDRHFDEFKASRFMPYPMPGHHFDPAIAARTYEQHLTSVTGGRGSYHMEFSHYDEVPSHQQQKIIAAFKAERGHAVEAEA